VRNQLGPTNGKVLQAYLAPIPAVKNPKSKVRGKIGECANLPRTFLKIL
jgi:hypothetical protein